MAIKSIEINNMLVFNKSVKLDFCASINVIIGENGAGKTSVLKLIYAAAQYPDNPAADKSDYFFDYFSCGQILDPYNLCNSENHDAFIHLVNSSGAFEIKLGKNQPVGISIKYEKDWFLDKSQALFIPACEMLSHSKGFLALNKKFKLPFDETQVDIIMNASLPETRGIPDNMKILLDKISKVIDGTVIMEDDAFYVVKKNNKKIEFSLEAEGLRKFGLLWKLIRNGLLESGSILLWDEPEANLNPELFPIAAEILLGLQKSGVQIFIATHSYNFAKYLEIRREKEEDVKFINLYRDETGSIISSDGSQLEDLTENHIMIADNKLLDEVFDM